MPTQTHALFYHLFDTVKQKEGTFWTRIFKVT